VHFSAPHRGGFRALVRDLGGRLKARVELRQISPRDETRLQGGIGPCGRDLCCAAFLKDFEPVSVRMAKDQDLPVNPLRITGACGRLMCCLKYEHPLCQDFRQDAPPTGAHVTTLVVFPAPDGPATTVIPAAGIRAVTSSRTRRPARTAVTCSNSTATTGRSSTWPLLRAFRVAPAPSEPPRLTGPEV
jgi:hypothetical protein